MIVEETTGTRFIMRFDEISSDDYPLVGAKAANEAELRKAGFTVPDAIVLTTDAFKQFLEANDIQSSQESEDILRGSIPQPTLDALHVGAADLGGDSLAVRSSGIAEDLPRASFAGQYETILDVHGEEGLEAAVRRCWASTFSPHAMAYRNEHGLSASGMAVLVQVMVPAETAGVAFSADPVSGDRETVVINAIRGLGERLVSGETSPDEWMVKGQEAQCKRAPEGAINARQAKAIAELAQRVEAHFGAPQDIEWALANGQLYVLQARPITTLEDEEPELVPISIEVPPGTWQQDASRFPDPVGPMFASVGPEIAMAAMKPAIESFGLLTDGLEIITIGGYAYQRLKPMGGKEPPNTPLPMPFMWLMVRLLPAMRARMKQAKLAVIEDKPGRYIDRWYDQWLPELEERIWNIRDMKLEEFSDRALVQHLEEVINFMTWAIEINSLVVTSHNFILYEFVATCRDLLGWNEVQAFELVSGTSPTSTEPGRRIHEMAQMANVRPAVRHLLEQIDESTAYRLQETDPEFAEAFIDYQRTYGCRAVRWEIMYPTLGERPVLTLSLIRDQMLRGYDPVQAGAQLEKERSEKAAEARAELAGHASELAHFERALERALKAYPLREATQFYTFGAPMALLRYAVLEIGRRLAERDVIRERDDVFFLRRDEAVSLLTGGNDERELVHHRKGEMAWARANPGPAFYGDSPPPPTFDFLPAEARLIMESLIWSFEQMMENEASKQTQAAGERLKGIAASPGQYTGTARIVADENEFHKIRPGDVMVCPMTGPAWSAIFPSLGALVTDAGGLLSHPAIIAREHRIPAVVATGNATSILHDGELLKVDGATGTVERVALSPER